MRRSQTAGEPTYVRFPVSRKTGRHKKAQTVHNLRRLNEGGLTADSEVGVLPDLGRRTLPSGQRSIDRGTSRRSVHAIAADDEARLLWQRCLSHLHAKVLSGRRTITVLFFADCEPTNVKLWYPAQHGTPLRHGGA